MPNAYRFKVNLHGTKAQKQVAEEKTFFWMLHMLNEKCYKNEHLMALPRRKIRDIIYKNKVRESYDFDPYT